MVVEFVLKKGIKAMKARIKFSKAGTMKFIGHLDIMRYFQKVIRRSGIDIAYSNGFNPHQLISFASPLGIGITSDAEYMDMQLQSELDAEELKRQLNEVCNEEIRILQCIPLEDSSKNAMSIVAAADYQISVKDGYSVLENWQSLWDEFFMQDSIIITKQTKRKEIEVDIRPLIYTYAFCREEFQKKVCSFSQESAADCYSNTNRLFLEVAASSADNLKPITVLEAFCNFHQISFSPYAYQIHRMEIYADKDGQLLPLDSIK